MFEILGGIGAIVILNGVLYWVLKPLAEPHRSYVALGGALCGTVLLGAFGAANGGSPNFAWSLSVYVPAFVALVAFTAVEVRLRRAFPTIRTWHGGKVVLVWMVGAVVAALGSLTGLVVAAYYPMPGLALLTLSTLGVFVLAVTVTWYWLGSREATGPAEERRGL